MTSVDKNQENFFIKGLIDFHLEYQNDEIYKFSIQYFSKSVFDLLGINSLSEQVNQLHEFIKTEVQYILEKFNYEHDSLCVPKFINKNLLLLSFFKKNENCYTLTIEAVLNNFILKSTLDNQHSVLLIDSNLDINSSIYNGEFKSFNNQNLIDRIHPKDIDIFILATNDLKYSLTKSIDVRFQDYDNIFKWKRLTFRRLGSPSIESYFFIVMNEDIEYLNKLENDLMAFKQKFERLIRITRTVLWEVNSEGIFTYVSPNCELIWGVKPENVVGNLNFYEIHPHEDVSNPKLHVFENHKTLENELAFEFSYQLSDTKRLWLFCFSSIEYDKNGNFVTYYGWDIDVSERKSAIDSVKQYSDELHHAITDLRIVQEHLEEHLFYQNTLIDEISATKEELEKSNYEKDKFFSIIAHDLRSPFSGFLGLTRMLDESIDFMEPSEIKELAKMLKDSASITYSLLENLLEWSRIQRQVIQFEPVETNLFLLISNVVQIQKANLERKNIRVQINVDRNTYLVFDQNMINTVLRNLVSNAVKFTPVDGQISITVNDEPDYVIILTKDSGIGMPDSIKENLFNIGAKTSREGTNGEASSGLGLLLCKEYVEFHKGKIWVETQENMGSTFYFSISKNIKIKESHEKY